jgi:hypothetical protein
MERNADALRTYLDEPDFFADAGAWFDWFERRPARALDCTPRRWIDDRGRCWEMVCTSFGPEIRRCFDEPLPIFPIRPQIVALRLDPDGYVVHIGSGGRLKARRIPHGQVSLRRLAAALLNRAPLPTADIARIPPTFWARQRDVVVRRPAGAVR